MSGIGWETDLGSHLITRSIAGQIGYCAVEGFSYVRLTEATVPKLGREMNYRTRQERVIGPRIGSM